MDVYCLFHAEPGPIFAFGGGNLTSLNISQHLLTSLQNSRHFRQ